MEDSRTLGAAIIAAALVLNQQFTLEGGLTNDRFGAAVEKAVAMMEHIEKAIGRT